MKINPTIVKFVSGLPQHLQSQIWMAVGRNLNKERRMMAEQASDRIKRSIPQASVKPLRSVPSDE